MNPQLLGYYNQELQFIRKMGTEFAQRYPKIAGRLDLGGTECADPYVERLLEGFAFLTARIQLKLDAEFPRFTQHLMEMVYPQYLAPTPSMTVVQFEADLNGGVTEQGFLLPRQTVLRSSTISEGHGTCKFRTAHEVMLWPLRLTEASYLPRGEAGRFVVPGLEGVKAGIRLRLETTGGIKFSQLALDQLPLYLRGSGGIPTQLYELLLGHALAVVIQPNENNTDGWREVLNRRTIQATGFDDKQALLPSGPRSFQGYRLLREYFTLPERFLFVDLCGLQRVLQRCDEVEALQIVILLDTELNELEDRVSIDNFSLFCTPAVNLFPNRADRIHLSHKSTEHHIIVDRTRPRDYEVFAVTEVEGFGSSSAPEQVFRPFYSLQDKMTDQDNHAFYTLRREPSLGSATRSQVTRSTPYQGSETYISLVDTHEAPYPSQLKQLGIQTLCTNRDLPQFMLTGQTKTDFTLAIGAPVNAVHCLTQPTDPKPAYPDGEHAWRLISHLSLNYLSLLNDNEEEGAAALRELLRLYGDFTDPSIGKQIEGLLSIDSDAVVRRIPVKGPMSFGRGVEIKINFNEHAFEGTGAFLFGAVLDRFFSKYVSINSFTQTVVTTRERGEIMRWPVRTGTRTLM